MGRFRNSVLVKVMWRVMGIYLLNINVDFTHLMLEEIALHYPEGLIENINEQDLKHHAAINKHNEHATEVHKWEKNVKIDLQVHIEGIKTINDNNPRKQKNNPEVDDRWASVYPIKDSPPPKN